VAQASRLCKRGLKPAATGKITRLNATWYNPDPETIRAALRCREPGCACRTHRCNVHCRAHDDTTPSLSVNQQDGKILMKCHGGCEQDRVISVLKEKGFWPSKNGDRPRARREFRGEPVAVYDFQDMDSISAR